MRVEEETYPGECQRLDDELVGRIVHGEPVDQPCHAKNREKKREKIEPESIMASQNTASYRGGGDGDKHTESENGLTVLPQCGNHAQHVYDRVQDMRHFVYFEIA